MGHAVFHAPILTVPCCVCTVAPLRPRFCEKHAAQVEQPDFRYMINAAAADWSGPTLWLSAFGEVVRPLDAREMPLLPRSLQPAHAARAQGDKLFGRNSNELHRLFDENYAAYEQITKAVPMTMFLFKLKVSEERYQDEPRMKYSIVSVTRPSFAEESRKLLDGIARMARGEPAEPVPAPPQMQGARPCPRVCARARARSGVSCVLQARSG
jgi:hypothetical protein